jgi:ADP-L-glycero-D-manno-heptose 6-epimerase
MIIITGAAGFIGSCLVRRLNDEGYVDLVLVDDFSKAEKKRNWEQRQYRELVDRDSFFEWVKGKGNQVQFIFHIGARTDTTEFNRELLNTLNFEYTCRMWDLCVLEGIPLVYASSAATYGMGEYGFSEDEQHMHLLKPLNPYGQSKLDFDLWALKQEKRPYFWAGLKFFNVYGPNEYHKGRMASVVLHAFEQIRSTGGLKLFRSHRPDYRDGEQKRDFVYVMDVVEVLVYLMKKRKDNGIYNLGSGKANTFNDLAGAIFKALDLQPRIHYIDTPADIRDKYQYYTEADMSKLVASGYSRPFTGIDEGVDDYIKHYLSGKTIY